MAEDSTISVGFDFFSDQAGRVIADEAAVREASHRLLLTLSQEVAETLEQKHVSAQAAVEKAIENKFGPIRGTPDDLQVDDFIEGSDFFLL